MPSGKVHDRITYLALLPAGVGVHVYTHSLPLTLMTCVGLLFGGLMFGPDLDTKSVQYFRWGPFRWIWWPYQRLFSHRSGWTHGIFLGPFTRLLYFSIVVSLLAMLVVALYNTYYQPLAWQRLVLFGTQEAQQFDRLSAVWAMGGLWLGGALHTWADWLHSCGRRRSRPSRSRRRWG